MILDMTEPEGTRATKIIPLAGRNILVKQMTDIQMLHLARFANILRSDEVEVQQKIDVSTKMLGVLHSCVSPEDREFLEEQEMLGNLTLRQMVGFASAFEEPENAPAATVVRARRGRAAR